MKELSQEHFDNLRSKDFSTLAEDIDFLKEKYGLQDYHVTLNVQPIHLFDFACLPPRKWKMCPDNHGNLRQTCVGADGLCP